MSTSIGPSLTSGLRSISSDSKNLDMFRVELRNPKPSTLVSLGVNLIESNAKSDKTGSGSVALTTKLNVIFCPTGINKLVGTLPAKLHLSLSATPPGALTE